jgi:serine/threonine-protein kinase
MAWICVQKVSFAECLVELKRAVALDPLSPIKQANLGRMLYYARRFDEALTQGRMAVEMDTSYAVSHYHLSTTYAQLRRADEAIAEANRFALHGGGRTIALYAIGRANASAGRRGEALRVAAELTDLSHRTYVAAYHVAAIYALLGDHAMAFRWLEQSRAERSDWIPLIRVDAAFDSLRSDPRFARLLEQLQPDGAER